MKSHLFSTVLVSLPLHPEVFAFQPCNYCPVLSISRLFIGKQEGKKQMKVLKAMQTNMPVFPPMDPCRCGAYHSSQCLIRRENMGGKERKGKLSQRIGHFFLPIIVVETESPIALSGFELLFKDSDVQTKI